MRSLYGIVIAASLLVTTTQVACGGETSVEHKQVVVDSRSSGVTIHDLPADLNFAGEKVPIEWGYVQEAIEREVLTTSCMHTSTTIALRNASRYFPVIEPILAEYGIPDDFKYLAVAESGLNVNAVSPARAAGLWQFLSSTGKEYKLEVSGGVDERYHVEKATRAACKYIKSAYELYGSWSLAAASYNAGRAGVSRRMGIQDVSNYWDLFLPEETMRYVPRILSFKILMADPAKYGFKLGEEDLLLPFKNFKIVAIDDANIVWSKFAAENGATYRQLRILNPWIRDYDQNNPSRKSYQVMVPTAGFLSEGH